VMWAMNGGRSVRDMVLPPAGRRDKHAGSRLSSTRPSGISYALSTLKPVSSQHSRALQGPRFLRLSYSAACISYAALPQGGKKVAESACSQFGIMQM